MLNEHVSDVCDFEVGYQRTETRIGGTLVKMECCVDDNVNERCARSTIYLAILIVGEFSGTPLLQA